MDGEVPMPLTVPGPEGGEVLVDEPAEGHAVTLVGFEDDDGLPGGGAFLFRNCWGTGWAADHTNHKGHGRLPYDYLERYAQAAYVIDELR
jgi:C1A family cysteine protease